MYFKQLFPLAFVVIRNQVLANRLSACIAGPITSIYTRGVS